MGKFTHRLKGNFLTGVIAILPVGLTIYISWFLLQILGNIFGRILAKVPQLHALPQFFITLLGLFMLLLLIYIVGLITSNLVGRKLLNFGERFLTRLPLIRSIYSASRQLTDTFLIDNAAFRRVVIVQWPRAGVYALGFVTNDVRWVLDNKGERKALNVFLPHTPNPTTGRFFVIPEDEIIPTSLSVESALKLIISGGIVAPSEEWCKINTK